MSRAATRAPGAAALAARLAGNLPLRYLIASGVALAADLGCFLAALSLGLAAVPAAALGYCAGLQVHWLISSRFVFSPETVWRGRAAFAQQMLFVSSAMVGLALTAGVVWAGTQAGADPRLAKLAAIGASFVATYLLRVTAVFR